VILGAVWTRSPTAGTTCWVACGSSRSTTRPPSRGSGGSWPGSALSSRPGLCSRRWTSSGRPCGRGWSWRG
jgi:hypothetical protein